MVAVLLFLLALGEAIVLHLYVGEVRRSTRLTLDLEYARGAALMAHAEAQRCWSRGDPRTSARLNIPE